MINFLWRNLDEFETRRHLEEYYSNASVNKKDLKIKMDVLNIIVEGRDPD